MSEGLPPELDTPRRRVINARMAEVVARLRERMTGHKFYHLTCGWIGDTLAPDWKCPRCGETYLD